MLSVFDIFKIGIGPSSSHTVGPMRAALSFARALAQRGVLEHVARVQVTLFGSLGATGRGHATDVGVMLGLMGEAPDSVDPSAVAPRLAALRQTHQLYLLGTQPLPFDPSVDIAFLGVQTQPQHPNALRLQAYDAQGGLLHRAQYYSVGGGFVVEEGVADEAGAARSAPPHRFSHADELVELAQTNGCSIAQLVWANECHWRSEAEVRSGVLRLWQVMQDCVRRGFGVDNPGADEALPGPLHIRRRAPELYRSLSASADKVSDPLAAMDWVDAFAMAVNEENAAGAAW